MHQSLKLRPPDPRGIAGNLTNHLVIPGTFPPLWVEKNLLNAPVRGTFNTNFSKIINRQYTSREHAGFEFVTNLYIYKQRLPAITVCIDSVFKAI
jgi:hypothetical protein